MSQLPHSRSEGALSLMSATGDASLFKSTGGLSSVASEGRITKRNGLSCEEANCFRRFPKPSSSVDEKLTLYWQNIGASRHKAMERGLHILPNEKGAFYNRPEFKNPMSATGEEWAARMSATRATHIFSPGSPVGRKTMAKPSRFHALHSAQSALEAEEEQLGRIVRLMFPSSRQTISRVGSSLRSRRSGTPASRPVSSMTSFTAHTSCWANTPSGYSGISPRPPPIITAHAQSGSDFHKTVSFDTAASPSGGNIKIEPVQWDVKTPVAGLEPMQLRSKLKLIKRETEMHHGDPSSKNGMKTPTARLVRQNTVDEGEMRCTFTLNKDHDEGKQVYKAMKTASIAAHHMIQAIGHETAAGRFQSILSTQLEKPSPDATLSRTTSASLGKPEHQHQVDHNSFSLRAFRKRILESYTSVLEAVNNLGDVDGNRKLSLKEFKTMLNTHDLCTTCEARVIFHLLDSNSHGTLTINEFHAGLECVAPVRDLEGMRRRLLCLGCTTMMQGLTVMNGGGEDSMLRPLNFNEFASALNRIWIVEPAEHRAIWEAVITDQRTRQNEATVSLAELASALCAVSPCLFLEELRDRLLKRFQTLQNAWGVLSTGGVAPRDLIDQEDFKRIAPQRLGLSSSEAAKASTLLDIDCSGAISRGEFLAAMTLASPSLVIEEVRRKVRQRYLSIDLAFRGAFSHLEGEELNNRLELSLEEFVDILEPLDIGRKDSSCLFHMMDGDQRGRLTLFEFFKGVRLVAPSCILEGIRLQLLQNYGGVAAAFRTVQSSERRAPLDRQGFTALMKELEVQCDDVHLIFDFLTVGGEPTVTINQIAACLLNVQPGSWNRAANEDREQRAEREVKSTLAHHHRAVHELKRRVKLGLREPTNQMPRIHRQKEEISKAPEAVASNDPNLRLPKVPQPHSLTRVQSLPADMHQEAPPPSALDRLAPGTASSEDGQRSLNARSTYHRLNRQFKQLAPEKAISGKTTDSLRGYFRSAHITIRDHDPLLQRNYTRTGVHRETQNLKRSAQPNFVQVQTTGAQDVQQLSHQ